MITVNVADETVTVAPPAQIIQIRPANSGVRVVAQGPQGPPGPPGPPGDAALESRVEQLESQYGELRADFQRIFGAREGGQ